MTDSRLSPWVEVGFVVRAHGIRGELRLATHDPTSEVLGEVESLRLGERVYPVSKARQAGDGWLVLLEGVADRTAAEALRGQPVAVARESLTLDDGEFLLSDLVGCKVELVDGTPWGEVVALELGPQDRLVVHTAFVERLIPVVDELLVEVDVQAGRIVVDLPEGMPETPLS